MTKETVQARMTVRRRLRCLPYLLSTLDPAQCGAAHTRQTGIRVPSILQALCLLTCVSACAQDDGEPTPTANPARPTVSTPATLSPTGYLQFENGALYAVTSPEFTNRLGIQQVTKLTLDSRVQFLALTEPFTHSTGAKVLRQSAR